MGNTVNLTIATNKEACGLFLSQSQHRKRKMSGYVYGTDVSLFLPLMNEK